MLFELAITFATTFMAPVQNKQQPPKTQVIYVKESKEPCTGVAPMECLQIKGVNDADWSNLYTNINGFKYTPGYRYKLRVRITQIQNPPADGSSLKYTLTKVLEKKKISSTTGNTSNNNWAAVGNKRWTLSMINQGQISNSDIWLEFDGAKKRFSGKGGCNNISGGYTAVKNKMTFTQAMSTRMMCGDAAIMRREADFLKQLGGHTFTYTVTGETINLYENGKLVMKFTLEDNGNDQQGTTPDDDSPWAFIGSKKWNVIKLNDATLSDAGIWMEFDTNQKRFHGKGGCNSISGGYNATGDQIKFTQGISTRMACVDADIMRRETEFLKLISENTFRYDVAEQTLNLYKDGKLVVIFGMQDKSL